MNRPRLPLEDVRARLRALVERARGATKDPRGEEGPPAMRVLRGYGPLVVLALLLILIAAFVPTSERDVVRVAGDGPASPGDGSSETLPVVIDPETGEVISGTPGGRAGDGRQAGASALPPGRTSACSDGRDLQVDGDTYSPPCIEFSGGNGGATSRGVTDDEIVISARVLDEPGFQEALAQLAGADIVDTPDDVRRTVGALTEYFNQRFQFYGRTLRVEFYDGKGSSQAEILGGGQEEAQQDARHAAREIQAFAELAAGTPPFADALSREQIVNLGAPYMSRKWFAERHPYAWALVPDCSVVVETAAEYALNKLYGKPARYAGGALAGVTRKFGTIAPENTWYQECVDDGETLLRKGGIPDDQLPFRVKYQLNLATMSNQATNVIAKLKDEEITSIFTGFDPVMAIFLTGKATEQSYQPEWIIVGVAVQDVDIVGQLFDQDSWSRAFGVSYLSEFQPVRASYGYNAYKAIRQDEPAFVVDLIYYQMYLLAIGIQLAGPNLTPETFAQGMDRYPGGTGPAGTWGFGPNDQTPPDDAREIWWDPNRRSVQNNELGAYVDTAPGTRYHRGEWPATEPRVFE